MSDPTPMTCREAFARLADYLDRELTEQELQQVREHVAVCAVCASEFKFEAEVLAALRERICRIAVPSDLATRIKAAIARQEPPPGDE